MLWNVRHIEKLNLIRPNMELSMGWSNRCLTKTFRKKQLFTYSCYNNTKKQLLTFVCKGIYIFKGIRRNWDTVGEYGPFTLLATDPKLCIFISLYLFKFLSRSLLPNICKNFYLLYLSSPKRDYSRPLSFPLDLLRETLSSYE